MTLCRERVYAGVRVGRKDGGRAGEKVCVREGRCV